VSVAAALLSAAPQILLGWMHAGERGREQRPSPTEAPRYLIELLSACRQGDEIAIEDGNRLLEESRSFVPPAGPQVMAAIDLFLRNVEAAQDPELETFILSVESRRFAIPRLVESVSSHFEVPAGSPLLDADSLACRHLMGSTVAELSAIQRALPHLTFAEVLAKPYSANRLAIMAARSRGIRLHEDSSEMPGLEARQFGSFAARHRTNARAVVDRYIEENARGKSSTLLVIDDGGALIDAVGQAVIDGSIQQPVVAIEQTTHGLFAVQRFMKDAKARQLGFACVSVARSEAKLRKESLLIARSIVETAESWLRLLGRPMRNVGIVGIGAVGAAVAKELSSRGIIIRVHDKNPNKLAVAEMLGDFEVAWTLSDLLRHSEIVIGASGGTSIDAAAADDLQDGTVLISASSGDLEFSGLGQWSMKLHPLLSGAAAPTPFDLSHGLLEATSHPARVGIRKVYVVNRGFPVNFDGRCDPIAVRDIQLTRALIVGAALQAAGAIDGVSLSGKTGVFELHRAVDQFVIEQYAKNAEA
jgi:hypothetical protein